VGGSLLIQVAPQVRILVAVEAVDGRKGIDAIAQLCREKLDADPFSGCLFIFRTRRGTAIRILQYDGQGFWLATKRLSKGRFRWWPTGTEAARTLRAYQAQLLLAVANPEAEVEISRASSYFRRYRRDSPAHRGEPWREPPQTVGDGLRSVAMETG